MNPFKTISIAKHIEKHFRVLSFDTGNGYANYIENKTLGGSTFVGFTQTPLGEIKEY